MFRITRIINLWKMSMSDPTKYFTKIILIRMFSEQTLKTMHFFFTNEFKSRTSSLISCVLNKRQEYSKALHKTREAQTRVERRNESNASKPEKPREGLTREKVNTRRFAMDIVKARAKLETRSPSTFPISSWAPCCYVGCIYTVGISYSKRSSRFPHIYLVRNVLRTGAANGEV